MRSRTSSIVRALLWIWLSPLVPSCVFSQPPKCVITNQETLPPSGADVHAPAAPPLKVLAFGTSLMWGNGLKEPHTFRKLTAQWLADQTKRPVQITTFAHSAAFLATPGTGTPLEGNQDWAIGDLNASLPSVQQQVGCAASRNDTNQADLIFLDGCINEVGAESIALPWTNHDQMISAAQFACGWLMSQQLENIVIHYPSARVIVVGYYPLISPESFGLFHSGKRSERYARKFYEAKHPGTNLNTPYVKFKGDPMSNPVIRNSEDFYQTSKIMISGAVASVNARHPGAALFAPLPEIKVNYGGASFTTVDPRFAFAASKHHLWWIPLPLFWKFALFADEKYGVRHDECKRNMKGLPAKEQLVCPFNVAFHPNRGGARAYASSMETVITPAMIAGWRNSTASTSSATAQIPQ